MHLPRAAPRDGRAVEFRVVFLQRRFAPVKGGLTWAGARPDPDDSSDESLWQSYCPSASPPAICWTRSTIRRRSLGSGMRMKALVSDKPSEVARKSDT